VFNVGDFAAYLQVVTNKYSSNETYVLYPCGVSKPDASQFPAGTKFFEIPLTSVSVDDTSVLAFLVGPGRPWLCDSHNLAVC
jgi:hypothetical protein